MFDTSEKKRSAGWGITGLVAGKWVGIQSVPKEVLDVPTRERQYGTHETEILAVTPVEPAMIFISAILLAIAAYAFHSARKTKSNRQTSIHEFE